MYYYVCINSCIINNKLNNKLNNNGGSFVCPYVLPPLPCLHYFGKADTTEKNLQNCHTDLVYYFVNNDKIIRNHDLFVPCLLLHRIVRERHYFFIFYMSTYNLI